MCDKIEFTVVYCCDDKYGLQLGVSVRSLVLCNKEISILVYDYGLTAQTKERLLACVEGTGNKIVFEKGSALDHLEGGCDSYVSLCSWGKVLVNRSIQTPYAILLDCDTLVLEDLHSLLTIFTSQIGERNVLGAVRDFGLPCGHSYVEERCGWRHSSYFNAGLLCIETESYIRALSDKVRSLGRTNFPYMEQDLLNVCFRDRWLELPFKWNVQGLGTYAHLRIANNDPPSLFTAEQFESMSRNPALVHFTGSCQTTPAMALDKYVKHPTKPVDYLCSHPFATNFFEIVDDTPWRGWRPTQESLVDATVEELVLFVSKVSESKSEFSEKKYWAGLLDQLRQFCE